MGGVVGHAGAGELDGADSVGEHHDDVADHPSCGEEVPLSTPPAERSAGLGELALILADIANKVASLTPVLDRALRERAHAIALTHNRRYAARRALARLRAADRALSRVFDLDVDFSQELIKDLSLITFHAEILKRALCAVPSYEFPIDHSEIRGWARLFAHAAGLDAGLVSRVKPDFIRREKRDLAEAVKHAQARVETMLNPERTRSSAVPDDHDDPNIND